MFSRRQASSVRALAELSEAQRLRLALAAAGDVVYDWTPGDGVMQWTGEPSTHLGFGEASQYASDNGFHALIDEAAAEARLRLVLSPPADGGAFHLEYSLKTGGAPIWVEERGVCLLAADGQAERIVGLVRNITERKLREAHLSWAASYDEMTGHLNRLRLREKLAEHLEMKPTVERKPAVYCVVAIDDLAVVNETYGFDTADEVIVAVGRRLGEAAGAKCVVGRTAGNKFGLILDGCTSSEMAERMAALRAAARARVVPTHGGAVSVSVSVGAVALPQDARNSQEAMARAEEALDRAKVHGRDNFAAYSHSPQRESLRKRTVSIGDQIVTALAENRIVLAYQAIVDAKSGEAVSHECLVRIARPEGQIIAAGDFVPVAEQLGLIRRLDRRVLELTVEALHKHRGASLSLNVSGMTASDRPTLESYVAYLEAHADVAPRMVVELTETAALIDIEESMRFVSRVRALGAKVAIDDFGAGYTSFRNLQSLHVDMVKIDGSFVKGLADSRDNQIFVRTLVDLAKNFKLETVAEWVAEAREADILKAFGVDYLQGFYYGKPEIKEPWTL
ncbi:MAG: bifunctional diguanylate cyclase/phosphodiesterase [Alphaproteobacteria bacterium]|nr:bifunctional diguanylate cyclase/phosphodiesterase [Alphaproteobacteria bacterium]